MKNLFILPLVFGFFILSCSTGNNPTYKVTTTVSPSEGGTITLSPSGGVYSKDEVVTLTGTPSNGWRFVRWEGDWSGESNPITMTMSKDYSVVGIFEKRNYPLTINIEGYGEVQERVIQQKTTEYPYQTVVELTPVPDEGWRFVEWGGDLSGNEVPINITIDKEKTITAKFVQKTYSLVTSVIGGGKVEYTPVLSSYAHGTPVSFAPVPDNGWTFHEWSGDLSGSSKVMQLTMTKNMNVVAEFKREVNADPILNVNVNWADLDALRRKADKRNQNRGKAYASTTDEPQLDDEIAHFGVRLIYPTSNALFIQSVAKTNDDTNQALITLEVPPANNIFMFAVAVSSNQAILFGTMDNINVVRGQEYDWKVENFTWTQPDWIVVDSLKSVYDSGTITVSKNATTFDLPIWVKNPFYDFLLRTPAGVNYDSSPIKINGNGGGGFTPKSDQFSDIIFTFENRNPGTAGTTIISNTYPRLDASMFNLPGNTYVIKDYLRGSINWE